MWIEGFGSYEDIEWAVNWKILTPFKKPKPGIITDIRKWLIRRFRAHLVKEDED